MKLGKISNYLVSFILAMLLMSFNDTYNSLRNQHIEVVMRMIGDEFLLQLGDSTSRIMPIKNDNGRYVISFEHELSFEPEILSMAAIKVVGQTKMPRKFIIETEKCSTNEVVHSFEISDNRDDSKMVPCKSRPLPKDCYNVYFTILDEENKPKPIPVKEKVVSADFSSIYLLVIGVFIIALVVYWLRKKNTVVVHPDWIQLGEYHFDKKGMKLICKGKSEELSSKEASLLELLYANINQNVTREDILQIVWGDEGDYLGRTLDVFISKLRKKLEADPNIKIVNIRGVGYRMVLN
ncbi:MAG: winged helix-turn-helix transcriptional regulator [Flavobacteriales bacterium]|nr:winged helix-turn-helix transcriptional regulator [Flavobacteriales bacterium]